MRTMIKYCEGYTDALTKMVDELHFLEGQNYVIVADKNSFRRLAPVMNLLPRCQLVGFTDLLDNYPIIQSALYRADEVGILLEASAELLLKIDRLEEVLDASPIMHFYVQETKGRNEEVRTRFREMIYSLSTDDQSHPF